VTVQDDGASEFDIVVIGGGSGGSVVAAGGVAPGAKSRARRKNRLGGDCSYGWYVEDLIKSARRPSDAPCRSTGTPRTLAVPHPDLARVMSASPA
jgi:hypothetical protein